MKIITFPVGSFEVNCSILSGPSGAWIVDPGSDGERIIAEIGKLGCAPSGVLLTHVHFDHIGAIPALQRRWPELPVFLDARDRPALGHPMNQFPPDYPAVPVPACLRTDWPACVEVIETPGHTPGGVCFYLKDEATLLSGDTLFAGSVGRTDFPGGSMDVLLKSLGKLMALPDNTRVIPGHGGFTTIGREREENPFIARG